MIVRFDFTQHISNSALHEIPVPGDNAFTRLCRTTYRLNLFRPDENQKYDVGGSLALPPPPHTHTQSTRDVTLSQPSVLDVKTFYGLFANTVLISNSGFRWHLLFFSPNAYRDLAAYEEYVLMHFDVTNRK